jgi:hypothetical protein
MNTIYEMIGKQFIVEGLCLKTRKQVEKIVTLTGILDGPGGDPRDYCTIEGYYDWEIDMPLENFIKMKKKAII